METIDLRPRLGLNVPAGWWPTAPMVKAIEAAGFGYVQVHTPPAAMLRDDARLRRHAAALRTTLDTGGLRLVLHGPDDLSVGRRDHDLAFEGLCAYAALTRADYVVYHVLNFPVGETAPERARAVERARAEERSLRGLLPLVERSGAAFAIENLAPVHPGPPRLCHSPAAVGELVRRLASERVGVLFDLGHANITAGLSGGDAISLLADVRDDVALFHVHDNLGARGGADDEAPGVDPLKLDLHLPPGSGRVPWDDLAPALREHPAPLVLEVHPPHRPEPLSLARVTAELLGRAPAPARP